jgi:hypothetical protein
MSRLVGNCGFASHDTTSDALKKYSVADEMALIRTPKTGLKGVYSPD